MIFPGLLGVIGHLAFTVGVILLLGWAIRHLPAYKLKQSALWCIGIGVGIMLLSIISGKMYGRFASDMMEQSGSEMMDQLP